MYILHIELNTCRYLPLRQRTYLCDPPASPQKSASHPPQYEGVRRTINGGAGRLKIVEDNQLGSLHVRPDVREYTVRTTITFSIISGRRYHIT
jgi:hypothetical protein